MFPNLLEHSSYSKFKCFCGKDFECDPEEILSNHIETCLAYKQESPLSNVFYKIDIKSLEIGQLLALRSEYIKHALSIKEEISKSKHK